MLCLDKPLCPGEVVRDWFPVPGTALRLPCTLLRGRRDGPRALITAGIHNAEFIGIQAAIELARELETDRIAGTVCILPLANRSGFENRTMSRVFEDGKNLNRVFPGDPQGTTAERLAHALFENCIRRADFFIDLHSGDGFESLTPYVYYLGGAPAQETARAMAACVNAKYCVRSLTRTGGAYNTASACGIPSVLIERGGLSRMDRGEIDADKSDVLNILRRMGVLDGEAKQFEKQELIERDDEAPLTGCWYPQKQPGEHFRKGEVLGEIRDYFGNLLYTHPAAEDGVLLYQTASLNLIEKGPMIAYGVPSPKP